MKKKNLFQKLGKYYKDITFQTKFTHASETKQLLILNQGRKYIVNWKCCETFSKQRENFWLRCVLSLKNQLALKRGDCEMHSNLIFTCSIAIC